MIVATTNVWMVALPAALGLLAVYCLLPRPSAPAGSRWAGAATGLAALTLAGWQMAAAAAPWIESLIFYSFSALALFGAVQLITQPSPARGAVSFALVVLSVCGLFLLHGAPFLAAGTIVIYAGAIVVTFLFVIMLCQPHGASDADARSREPLLSCAAGAVLLGLMLGLLSQQYDPGPVERLLVAVDTAAASNRTDLGQVEEAFAHFPHHLAVREMLDLKLNDAIDQVRRVDDPTVTRAKLAEFRTVLLTARAQVGDIRPPANVPLSPYGGGMNNDRRLPANNVAGLGRLLFTDFILGVEIAGTLLLVATIGAIAIVHRTGRKLA